MTLEDATDRINGTSLNLGAFNFDNTSHNHRGQPEVHLSYMQKPEYIEDATIQYGRIHVSVANPRFTETAGRFNNGNAWQTLFLLRELITETFRRS